MPAAFSLLFSAKASSSFLAWTPLFRFREVN
jgi:hypothetical protein